MKASRLIEILRRHMESNGGDVDVFVSPMGWGEVPSPGELTDSMEPVARAWLYPVLGRVIIGAHKTQHAEGRR